ncbi:MAG: bacillithiol biosynthesis deacetylase BshB1 [Daejeonella sp.]
MKLDILVFAVHPDDAELSCSGTIIKHLHLGKKVGIVDLTRGELGTRGSAEIRDVEAANSAKVMGLTVRENLAMRDGFFQNDEDHQKEIIRMLRKYKPEIVLSNAMEDRHPDHGKAGELINDSVFLSGLSKIETKNEGEIQEAWRPRLILQYIQDRYIKPDILVDVTDFWDVKMKSIAAFETQFFNPDGDENGTYISAPGFLQLIDARARDFGRYINTTYAEGFTSRKLLGVDNLFNLS